MHEEFARAKIADGYVLDDPPDDAETVASEVVARFADGSLTYEP